MPDTETLCNKRSRTVDHRPCILPKGHTSSCKSEMPNADDFLADAYAKLPINSKPWQCMTCNERFATLAEIDAHLSPEDECPNA